MRLLFVIALGVVCACSSDGRALHDWTLAAREGQPEQRVHIPDGLARPLWGANDQTFVLHHALGLTDSERGRPLTVHVDCFHAPLALHIDDVDIPDDGVLRLGTHRFVIPAELTRSDSITLQLTGAGARPAALFGAAPRIESGVESEPNAVASFNYALGVIALASMVLLTFVFAAIYLLDRRRDYAAGVIAMASTVVMPLTGLLPGRVSTVAFHVTIAINFAAVLAFTAAYFDIRVSRRWNIWLQLLALASLTCLVAESAMPVMVAIATLTRLVFFVYMVVFLGRLAIRSARRGDARTLFVGFIGVLVFTAADITPRLFGIPAAVHLGPLSTVATSIATAIVILRRHAHDLASLERARAELRWQITARTRELSEALAKLAASTELVPQRIVDGRYRIVRHVGAGGMGSVHEAERVGDGERVALKVLHGAADATAAARLAREAHVAASVVHPNLVPVIDVGIDSNSVFLVMPLIRGGSLDRQLPLSGPARVKAILADVAAGLAALHEHGLVHRDLKPANILLDGERARLSDFGLVSVQRSEALAESTLAPGEVPLTELGGVPGTPRYMAPELRNGASQATHATDVYAFGVIARDLADGMSRPPDWLLSVADRCTHADATQRPTAAALVAELLENQG